MLPKKLNSDTFIRPDKLEQPITISNFVEVLEAHSGLFSVDGAEYDNILYCGTDNLYFSYCFNYLTGRAVSETLIIVDSVVKLSDISYMINVGTKESIILLKE